MSDFAQGLLVGVSLTLVGSFVLVLILAFAMRKDKE